MSTENNPYTVILITLNVVSLLVIFWLIYFIINHFDNRPYAAYNRPPQTVASNASAPAKARGPVKKPHVSGRPAQIKDLESRINLAIEKFKSSIEQDVYADLTRTDDPTENRVNQLKKAQFDIEQSLKALRKLAREDVEYLEQYKQMKTADAPKTVASVTPEQARQVAARDRAATPGDKPDTFNKVDVSRAYTDRAIARSQNLAQRIRSLLAEQQNQPGKDNNQLISKLEKTYIASIQPAAGERQNAMRTIRVRRGDTLWKISQRAYGTGFAYKRIFEANPHLTSPDDITTGEILRVPL